jgi:hypothetical protein
MEYQSAKHYKDVHKARGRWSRVNDYEVFNWGFCLECSHFKMSVSLPIHGDCKLMEKEGAYPGVMAQATCDRFLSKQGVNHDGQVIKPEWLPGWVLTRKDQSGRVFVVQETEKQEARRLTRELKAMRGKV